MFQIAMARAFAVLAVIAAVAGCNSQVKRDWWPWYEPDQTAELAKYGPTSGQKIERLQAIAKDLAAKPNEETLHARVSTELSEQIRQESDPLVRVSIVRTLGEARSPMASAVLAAAMKDPDDDARIAACESLGKKNDPEAMRLLGDSLASDTSSDVRASAARALGAMRNPAAVPLLAVALEDPDPALQYRAVESLKLATGKDLGDDVPRWREYAKNPAADGGEISLAERLRRLF